jgi:energy-coupling factor transporter ATP-binding protein EcfA2
MMENENPFEEIDEPIVETLESEVKAFAEARAYWSKFLCKKLLLGTEIKEKDIELAYSYLLQDSELKERTVHPAITIDYGSDPRGIYKKDLFLIKLQNVQGVNALAENQSIEFSPNLTIVYGSNGSGKSGYVRLLNNVFLSRGDKSIRPNIYIESGHKVVDAEFVFQSSDHSYCINYAETNKHSEFQQFSVFDGKSVIQLLDNANEYEFRPSGLNFFSDFTDIVSRVEAKLIAEINSKISDNKYPNYFDDESIIKSLLLNLNYETDINEIKKHVPFKAADKLEKDKLTKELDELNLNIRQKADKLKSLRDVKEKISVLKQTIIYYNKFFTSAYFKQIHIAINDSIKKEEIAKKEGIQNFKSNNLRNVGSIEWKQFIEAAEKFAQKQLKVIGTYPDDSDVCLFCHQALSYDAQTLISRYWQFLKSQATRAAVDAQNLLDRMKKGFEDLNFNLLPLDNVLGVWLTNKFPNTAHNLKIRFQKQKLLAAGIISDIANKTASKREEYQIETGDLDSITHQIDLEIQKLVGIEQSESLNTIKKSLNYLIHKEKLQLYFSEISKYVENLKWIATAKQIPWQSFKKKITDTEKSLSKKYFNQAYINSFKKECLELEGNFGIEVHHSGGGGTSYRQLFIENNTPSEILSEGEQKVISLSDFLSEIKLSGVNRGIIFDDPVNSLDEERKNIIAKRLVIEAAERQVIIFTHDLIFVYYLLNYAKDNSIVCNCHWIEKTKNGAGHIYPNNTPSHDKKYRNTEPAKECYSKAKDAEPEEKERQIKYGFAALRTCYETFVINDLFANVVQRFNDRVSVMSLSSIYYDDEIIAETISNFERCCKYMEGHTHSDKFSLLKPEAKTLLEEINILDALRKKYNGILKSKGKK